MAAPAPPVDPNVRLPAAVVAATARALALQEEQRREMAGEVSPPSPNAEPPISPPPLQQPEVPDQLEHKLKSTEGRLAKAERERAALAARLAAIESQRPVPRETPRQEPPIQIKKLVTPEEEEEYGTDFLNVVAKKAREELAGEMFKIQRQINDLSGSVGTVRQAVDTDAREKMKTELDGLLPQWREINYNDRYISWLALPDPFSGIIRHELLKAAYSSNQTGRVLAFFRAFLADEAAGIPPSPGTNGQAPPNGSGAPPARIPLENLAAPGRASPAASPVPADRPIITRAQITQFYADVAQGKYRGRESEKLENDAAIIRAANEGRIV